MNKWKSMSLKLLVFGSHLFFTYQSLAENYLECERRVGAQQAAECKKLSSNPTIVRDCQSKILDEHIKKKCKRLPLNVCMDAVDAEGRQALSACGPDEETPEEIQAILKVQQCHDTTKAEYHAQTKVCATNKDTEGACRAQAKEKLDSGLAACGPTGSTPEIRARVAAAKECKKESKARTVAAREKCKSDDPGKDCYRKKPVERIECLDKLAIPPK